jgi:hypothetical protein
MDAAENDYTKEQGKPDPKPDTLGDPEDPVRRFLRVQRPPEGWPEEVKRTRKPKR